MIAEMDLDEYQKMWGTVQAVADKRRMKKKKQRHQLARMTVDVYRLFKIRDAADALKLSGNSVAAQLAMQIWNEAAYMLKPYIERQKQLVSDSDFLKAVTSLEQPKSRRKSSLKPKPRRRIRLG